VHPSEVSRRQRRSRFASGDRVRSVGAMIVFRPSARALITDPSDRILLMRVRDATPLDASNPVTEYWITVGGGVESGETFETAVVREIFEETGHIVDDPGPHIWLRRKSITDAAGVTRATDERYFWCPLPSAELNHDNLTQYERSYIQEFRWWAIDDPDLLGVRIFPADFIPAARSVLRHGRPAAARWLR
jgi:8-oxo-dGTP pyrophosphatase MutT (NUDIX family)